MNHYHFAGFFPHAKALAKVFLAAHMNHYHFAGFYPHVKALAKGIEGLKGNHASAGAKASVGLIVSC